MSLALFFLFFLLLWPFSVFFYPVEILEFYLLVLWRMSLICLCGLHWVCRWLWITYTFNDINSSNMEYPLPISDIFYCLNHHFLVFSIQCLPSWVINTPQYFWCCYKRAAFLTSFSDITLLIFGNTTVVGWHCVLPLYQVPFISANTEVVDSVGVPGFKVIWPWNILISLLNDCYFYFSASYSG